MTTSAPELRSSVKSFGEAQARAAKLIESGERVRELISHAEKSGKQNYEFLLGPWESIQIFVRMLKAWLNGWYAPSTVTLLAVVAALVYLVEPFDLIPDHLPVFGLLDDAAIITAVAKMNVTQISQFRVWEETVAGRANIGVVAGHSESLSDS